MPHNTLDIEQALGNLGGDRELFEEVLISFLESLPATVSELRESIAQSDLDRVHRVAHSLKGSAANVCAEHTRELAAQMELLGSKGESGSLSVLLSKLEASIKELQTCAKAHVKSPETNIA